MDREREHSSRPKAKAKTQVNRRESGKEKAQSRSSSISPDKRLARIVSQGSGQFQTYNPAKDRTGRGAQNRQFLDKYIRANGAGHIQKTDDGRYQIDRLAAIESIQKNRGSASSAPLGEQTKKEFRFKGEKQPDGSLLLDPSKTLGKKDQIRFHNTLINRLEAALDRGEQGLSQTPDGRYKLEAGHIKASSSQEQTKQRERTAKVDQRLARIVGTEPGKSMLYDPMKDKSGQSSKNTEYLEKLSKFNPFIEPLGAGRYAIDRHAANDAISSAYPQNSEKEPTQKLKNTFSQHGTTIERGLQAITPASLKQKDFQPVINSLEKALREGTKGVSKTQDGAYLMSGHVDSGERGPTLTPTKNWQFWSDLAQRDGLKAVMAGSPMRKEGDMSPSLSLSPESEKKQESKLSAKVATLTEMQDDRDKQRERSREQDQKQAQQQRKNLELQLAAEQARLNQELKKHWGSAGVNNVQMQYRQDKNQQPLKGPDQLSPSTQKEYAKIARRLENIHPLQMPDYLQKRADQASRQTWWKEHAVARRMLLSAEKQHFANGENQQGREIAATRNNIQGMDYQSNRSQAPTKSHSKRGSQFNPEFYNQLLEERAKNGDQELHDSLVISKETGLRPAELQKGVHMRVTNEATNEVAINIKGAKKSQGIEEAPNRYQNDHGQDRLLIVKSEDLSELAKRHDGYFKPESSEDALRMRLDRATDKLDPQNEQNFSFYTLRHNSADEMREQGKSRREIALQMGHLSEQTQEEYGLNA